MNSKLLIIISGFLGAVAVALGALGAHALKDALSPELLAAYKTANDYHIYHSIALLAIVGLKKRIGEKNTNIISFLWILGTLVFSGSIYLLAMREIWDMPGLAKLGPVTPIGGVFLILGWIFAGIAGFKASGSNGKGHSKAR